MKVVLLFTLVGAAVASKDILYADCQADYASVDQCYKVHDILVARLQSYADPKSGQYRLKSESPTLVTGERTTMSGNYTDSIQFAIAAYPDGSG